MTEIRKFRICTDPTPRVYMPTLDETFVEAGEIPDNLLRPFVRVDGGEFAPALRGLPLAIVAHEVGIDQLVFRVEEDGRYRLEAYDQLEIDPATPLRPQLEAYIEEAHGGPEDLEDENAELFDEDEPRAYLEPDADGEVGLHLAGARWIQNTLEPPIAESPHFVFALMDHPILFGAYYLFVDPESRRVRQVFQCT